ncbi:hypothetical protein SK128_022203 [Halocaridina rubra]|uniref:Uncharacterized protein n=1 Tax=Halocaridina rubra TaxID=373956 RepID=A0AAN9A754_HALRR
MPIPDVSCGQPLSQPSSKLDHTSKECTRKAEFPQHGKTSHNSSITLPSSSLQSNMMSDGSGKSLALVTENSKSSLKAVDSNSGVIGAHSRTNNSGNNIPSALGTRMINGPVVSDSGLSVVRGVLSSEKGGDSSVLGDAVTKEKPIVGSTSGVDGVAGLSVPPGFHHLRQEGQNFANQPQAVKESTGLGMNSNQSMTGNKKISSHAPNQESVHPLSNSQHHALQLERQHIQSQSQHHIPHHKPQKYVDSWPHVISHQYVNPNPQESVKKNLIHQTATAATSAQNSQPQQQQYYYSITPAALFHMASQAAGGQLSAVLMPNTNESNSNRTGSSIPTSSTGTPNSSISAPPPPPPGFTAPVTINYPNQQLDAAMPFNKLVMGSPLYRSPVSQAEGQQVVPSTASQSFITPLGQSVGGMPGVYALQHSSSGSQFPTINPTGAAHSPQGLNDQNVNQQQVTFDSRQFLSQVPQGLHQGMQGVPQNLTPIPPGISQGVAQTLPQQLQGAPAAPPGLSTSVPQGVQGVSQGLHQSLVGGVPQVSMGQALSPGLQPMPIGHHIPQHYPHPSFPQQGYQMAVPGPGAYYPEFVFSDPSIQTPSPGTQGELIQDMSAFQRPDVYDTQMPALPQYLASSLPQHQNLLSPSLTNISLAPQHGPPTAAGPGPAYTPSSVIFIEGERDGSQILQ